MILLFPYCQVDEPLAAKTAKWLMSLRNDTPLRVVVVKDSKCSTPDWFGDKTIDVVSYKNPNEWPQGNNVAFSSGARFLEYKYPTEKSFLWLEPDAIPLKDGWLDKLVTEHTKSKKHFTGSYVPGAPGQDHLSGIAIYPNPLVLFAGAMLMVDNESIPFDVVDGPNVVRQSNLTDLIQNRPRQAVRQGDRWVRSNTEQRFNSLEDFYKVATKECVLFHADKNGDLIDIFTGRHGEQQKPVTASPDLRGSTGDLPKPASESPLNGQILMHEEWTLQDHVNWIKKYAEKDGFARMRCYKELIQAGLREKKKK